MQTAFKLKFISKNFLLIICCFIQVHSYSQCPELEILNLKKTALIFGEKNYQFANPLKNTMNDAEDIADSLRKIGFDVNVYFNSNIKTMNTIIDQWCSKLSNYNVALFYFSGHGAEYNSENYLFPIDANPKSPNEMSIQCTSANALLSRIESYNLRYNVMILDACRSNPFTKSWSRDFSNGGLAAMTGNGSFVGYAASPGQTASDGRGRNGTYTEAILKYITVPELTIDQIFTKVNLYVRTMTKEGQIPFKSSSLSSDYCFSVKRTQQSFKKPEIFFMQPTSQALITNDQSFLINSTDSGIAIKDALTLSTLQSVNINHDGPLQIASKTGEYVITIDSTSRKIYNIDTHRKIIIDSLSLDYAPTAIALSSIGNKAYVTFMDYKSGGFYILDLSENKILKIIKLRLNPISILLSNDDKRLFILARDSLAQLDANTGKIIKKISITNEGKSIGLSPDNKTLLIGCEKNNLGKTLIYDASTLKLKKALEFPSTLFSFSFDNINAFAINAKELYIINMQSLAIINRLSFRSNIKGIAVSSDGIANVWLPTENRFHLYKINQLLNSAAIDPEIKLKEFKEKAKNEYLDEMNDYNSIKRFFDTLQFVYETTVNQIKNELGPAFSVPRKGGMIFINSGDSIGLYAPNSFGDTYGIYAFDKTKNILTHYIGKISSGEFILTIYGTNQPEVYNVPKADIDWNDVEAFIRKYFLLRLDQLRK